MKADIDAVAPHCCCLACIHCLCSLAPTLLPSQFPLHSSHSSRSGHSCSSNSSNGHSKSGGLNSGGHNSNTNSTMMIWTGEIETGQYFQTEMVCGVPRDSCVRVDVSHSAYPSEVAWRIKAAAEDGGAAERYDGSI